MGRYWRYCWTKGIPICNWRVTCPILMFYHFFVIRIMFCPGFWWWRVTHNSQTHCSQFQWQFQVFYCFGFECRRRNSFWFLQNLWFWLSFILHSPYTLVSTAIAARSHRSDRRGLMKLSWVFQVTIVIVTSVTIDVTKYDGLVLFLRWTRELSR